MAKAIVQARGGRATGRALAQRRTAKAQAGGQPRARGEKTWAKVRPLVILLPFAAVLPPTTLVLSVMTAPTWLAHISDRSRDNQPPTAVAMLQVAAPLHATITLSSPGQHP